MACIINGQSDEFVVFSPLRAQWMWVKGRDAVEYLSASTVPKLKYANGILFNLLPSGWIVPHPETVMKVGWSKASGYLVACFKHLLGTYDVDEETRCYCRTAPDGEVCEQTVCCRDVEWKARLSPFLVEYHPIHYQHPDWYPALYLKFFFPWEVGERGVFATQCDANQDFPWAKRVKGDGGNPDFLINYKGYWDWLDEIKNRGKAEIIYPWDKPRHKPRQPRGGSKRLRSNEGLQLGNLTRRKESMSDSDERAISRDLGCCRS